MTAAVMGAHRWTTADAASVLAAASASGLSSRRFAIEQRLARWRRQLDGARVAEATFVEVARPLVPAVRAGGFDVVLAAGRVVRVGLGFDAEELLRLLAVLEEGSC